LERGNDLKEFGVFEVNKNYIIDRTQ
jgi:hypothetical protein